jgi:hypothetical protein
MEPSGLLDIARKLVREAEHLCGDADVGMQEAAAMVYVGDVYALFVINATDGERCKEVAPADAIWPFIR